MTKLTLEDVKDYPWDKSTWYAIPKDATFYETMAILSGEPNYGTVNQPKEKPRAKT